MKLLAQIISVITNPLVIVFPSAYALVYRVTHNSLISLHWSLVSLLFSGFIALFVLYGMRKKFFSNYDVSRRRQRDKLFIFAIVIIIIYLIMILFFDGPKVLLITLIGVLIGISIAGLVNTQIKASMHVAVFSCFIYSLVLLYGKYFVFGIVLIPLVAWARIIVRRHTKQEVLAGAGLGILLISILYVIFTIQGVRV